MCERNGERKKSPSNTCMYLSINLGKREFDLIMLVSNVELTGKSVWFDRNFNSMTWKLSCMSVSNEIHILYARKNTQFSQTLTSADTESLISLKIDGKFQCSNLLPFFIKTFRFFFIIAFLCGLVCILDNFLEVFFFL